MSGRFVGAVGVALAVLGGTARAEDYAIIWTIVPEAMPAEATMVVGNYTTLISARLLPPRLFQLGADAKDSSGRLAAAAGTQLVAAVSDTIIGCVFAEPRKRGLMGFMEPDRAKYQCFIDRDGDGRLEESFQHVVGVPPTITDSAVTTVGVLVGSGRVPSRGSAIPPVAYTSIDPADIINGPRLHFQYGWYAGLANALVFQSCFQPNDRTGNSCFLTWGPDANDLPTIVRAQGAEFRVEAREKPGVRGTLLRTFEAGPLFVDN